MTSLADLTLNFRIRLSYFLTITFHFTYFPLHLLSYFTQHTFTACSNFCFSAPCRHSPLPNLSHEITYKLRIVVSPNASGMQEFHILDGWKSSEIKIIFVRQGAVLSYKCSEVYNCCVQDISGEGKILRMAFLSAQS